MTTKVGDVLRDLLRNDPRLAILTGEVLGAPVGAPDAPVRPWEK